MGIRHFIQQLLRDDAGRVRVVGAVDSDGVSVGSPVQIGGVVDETTPVSAAEGDARSFRATPEGNGIVELRVNDTALADASGVLVQGSVASDGVSAGNPVKSGGEVDDTSPVAAAEGDVRTFRSTPEGNQITEPYRDNTPLFPVPAALADALANPTLALIGGLSHLFNGSTFDRARNNEEVVALASAARTVDTNTATLTNYNGRGLLALLNVTLVSGTTPTLDGSLQAFIPAPADWTTMEGSGGVNVTHTQITAAVTGQKTQVAPGLSQDTTGANRAYNSLVPRRYRWTFTVGGTSPSFTFSQDDLHLN